MDISHTLYSAYRCNRQLQTGKICVATLPTRVLALPINYAIITTYAYNMQNKLKLKTSCLQPKHNCSTAVCTANKLPHTTVINRFNSQCTFICDTGSSNATFVLWQIQNILNWVSNFEHVCFHCPSLDIWNSFYATFNTFHAVQEQTEGHPTLRSASSTVELFCHVRHGWRCTAVQCHQLVDHVGCSQLAESRLIKEPWQRSMPATSYLWECPDRLLPDCWCCSDRFVSGRSPGMPHITWLNQLPMWKKNKLQKSVLRGTDGRLLLSGFQAIVTLILTLDWVIRHTVVHHSSTSIYTPNFTEIGKTFFWTD